jgi:hypothetical protein
MKSLLAWTMTYSSILAFSLADPAMAQTASDPLLSLKRLSVGAGIERENLLAYANEEQAWRAVLPIAYNVLSPPAGAKGIRLSVTARVAQSLDFNAQTELWLGARVTLWRGAQ